MKPKNNIFRHEPLQYKAFRPSYPPELFSFLKEITKGEKILECGAGSGQATKELAHYFSEVIACDFSYALLKQYRPLENTLLVHCKAEKLPIVTGSIQLICIAQALHWFSLKDFYSEAKRVLCDNGIIAAWCYNQAVIDPIIDDIISREVYEKITRAAELLPEAKYVHDGYRTIPFPFKKEESPTFEMRVTWDLNQLLGYINTWPSVLEYENRFHVNLVNNLGEKLRNLWGNPESTRVLCWPLYLRIGRNVL